MRHRQPLALRLHRRGRDPRVHPGQRPSAAPRRARRGTNGVDVAWDASARVVAGDTLEYLRRRATGRTRRDVRLLVRGLGQRPGAPAGPFARFTIPGSPTSRAQRSRARSRPRTRWAPRSTDDRGDLAVEAGPAGEDRPDPIAPLSGNPAAPGGDLLRVTARQPPGLGGKFAVCISPRRPVRGQGGSAARPQTTTARPAPAVHLPPPREAGGEARDGRSSRSRPSPGSRGEELDATPGLLARPPDTMFRVEPSERPRQIATFRGCSRDD